MASATFPRPEREICSSEMPSCMETAPRWMDSSEAEVCRFAVAVTVTSDSPIASDFIAISITVALPSTTVMSVTVWVA